MEILWLVVAFVAGALVAWIYVGMQNSKKLKEREAQLQKETAKAQDALTSESANHKKTQQALTKAESKAAAADERAEAVEATLEKTDEKLKKVRSDQRKTKRALTKAEAAEVAASERVASLESDLTKATDKLTKERDDHKSAKQLMSELKSTEAKATTQASALAADVEKLRSAAEASKAAEQDRSGKLKELQAQNKDLGSRLKSAEGAQATAESERADLLERLQKAEAAAGSAGDEEIARVAELQKSLDENDEELERLEGELAAAREELQTLKASGAPSGDVDGPDESGADAEPQGDHSEITEAPDGGAIEESSDAPAAPQGASADDLTEINGIGEALQVKLVNLGITSIRQIAAFTPADIDRVNGVLDFPGRIERERWVEQARAMVSGTEVE